MNTSFNHCAAKNLSKVFWASVLLSLGMSALWLIQSVEETEPVSDEMISFMIHLNRSNSAAENSDVCL